MPTLELTDRKYIIRTSDRIAYKKCRREWDWSSIMRHNYVPAKGSKPLEFGTDWHVGMATYYDPMMWQFLKNPKTRHIVHATVMASYVTSHAFHLNKYRNPETGDIDETVKEDFAERLDLGKKMLRHYFQWAPTVDHFKPLYVEVDFEVPVLAPDGNQLRMPANNGARKYSGGGLETWPVVYQGRLDGIVEDQYGWYWILEHKTAAQFGATEHLVLDEQTGSYAWAVKHMLGIRVQGVIYSEALKDFPEPPKELVNMREGRRFSVNKTQRTTFDLALETLSNAREDLSLYAEYLDYLKIEGNKFFRRLQVHRNLHELEDIGHRIYQEATEMLNPDLLIYPNPNRFNCSGCSFRIPCIAKNDGSDYEYLLQTDYRNRTQVEIDARRARA